MNSSDLPLPISEEVIKGKIYIIRGQRIMLDSDLAELYDVETKVLKQAVKRNQDIFPEHFMFELTESEFKNLRSQNVTSSWGGQRYLPFAFTEHGVLQLANVLRSKRARIMSIRIIEVFIKIRELLSTNKEIFEKIEQLEKNDRKHDEKITLIFGYLKQLEKARQMESDQMKRTRIGFKSQK